MTDDELVDLSEAAAALGVSTVWLHRAATRGDIEATQVKDRWKFSDRQVKAAAQYLARKPKKGRR